MTLKSRLRTGVALLGVLSVASLASIIGGAATPRFLPDDPIQVERDTEDASGMRNHEPNLFVDFAYNTLTGAKPASSPRAGNINTIDEVPDSSWYTNRHGLTAADVKKGPNRDNGPAAGNWTVTSSKSDGVTPGFTIKDANGQRWFLKFDPPGMRGMATGTEVTVTRLMWALGYNVPENHIAYLQREQLLVGDGAKFTTASGTTRGMKANDIDKLLERANREGDGRYRVVASRALDGKPIGRIKFIGTRSDDPNDIVAHEHRRELRAYGTFAAWLNHVDAKGINSLDMLVTENGRASVKHNLIDFGSALGSGATDAAEYWAGSQYFVDGEQVLSRMFSFGANPPKWHSVPFYESPAIGRLPLNNASFDPEAWKPREPNRAFLNSRRDDKFWAAERLASISREMIAAAVAAGELGNAKDEEFLVHAIAERRDAILRAYLPAVNPISAPSLGQDGMLSFRNTAVDADVARTPEEYRGVFYTFDNMTGGAEFVGESRSVATTMPVPADAAMADAEFVKVSVSATSREHEAWDTAVDAYFQRTANGWRLVGFERMPEAPIRVTTTD